MARARVSVGLHIHAYVWVFMVLFGVAPFLGPFMTGIETSAQMRLSIGLALIVVVQTLLWFTQRRCSDDDLSFWDGPLVVAACMAIGVGWLSVVIVLPALLITVVLSFVFAVTGFVLHSPEFAPYQYKKLVTWFQRHRMYQ